MIPRGEIRAVALGHAPGRYRLREIDAAIERLCREGELVETKSRGADTAYVTDRAIRSERRMLATMRAGRGKALPLADVETPEARRVLSRLTAGQRDAVRLVLLSRDTVVGVQGHAGTGKTTMLKTAASVLRGTQDRGTGAFVGGSTGPFPGGRDRGPDPPVVSPALREPLRSGPPRPGAQGLRGHGARGR